MSAETEISAETGISTETGISSETAEGERRMQEKKRYRHGGEADQKAAVRLDFSINVNPLGLPRGVKKVLQEGMDALTRYPDPECSRLREALSKRYFLPEEDILCGNGASELLMLLALARKPKKVLLTAPSFFGYERAFERCGANLSFYFLAREDHFAIREDYLSCLQRENPDLVVLTQPANPAGNLIAEERRMRIWRYCKEHGIFLLVDECFLSLVKGGEDHTMLPFLVQDPNLMVLRAFTKTYAMPGLRLGFVLSSNLSLLLQMASYQPEWSVSVMAQQAGIRALQEETYLQNSLHLIAEERDFLRRGLRERGMEVFFSEANFLLFFTDKDVAEPLLKKGILIRDCSNYRGLKRGYYRVAVKKRKENEELLRALDEVLEEERRGEIHGVHTSFTGRN